MPSLNGKTAPTEETLITTAADARRAASSRHYRSLQTNVQDLEDTRRLRSSADEKLRRFELSNERLGSLSAHEITVQAMWLASLPAACLIDSMLLVDAGREITKGYSAVLTAMVGSSVWPTLIVSAALALSFILLEVASGNRLSREREEGRRIFNSATLTCDGDRLAEGEGIFVRTRQQ